jgi:hypothetical protein
MTVSVFVGTSVDGFIARPNDDLDFLPEGRRRTPWLQRVHGKRRCARDRSKDLREGPDL